MGRTALLALAMAGCTSNTVATLADLPPTQLNAFVPARWRPDPHLAVALRFSAADTCPAFDVADLRATAGGTTLDFSGTTFDEPNGTSGGGNECSLNFGAPYEQPVDGVVTVSDSTLIIRGSFDRDALEMRSAQHPTWVFTRGETAAIRWSPPGDFADSLGPQVSIVSAEVQATVVAPDMLVFTVPSSEATGAGTARVDMLTPYYADESLECFNASLCQVHQDRIDRQQATIN